MLKILARYVVLKTNAVTMEGASLDVATLVSFCQTMLQNAMRGAGRQDASRGMNLCAARDVSSRRKIPTARHKRWSKWSWRSRTKLATYSELSHPPSPVRIFLSVHLGVQSHPSAPFPITPSLFCLDSSIYLFPTTFIQFTSQSLRYSFITSRST